MDQPFLNYDQQIDKLKSKNLTIDDEEEAKRILSNTSYYSLMNGYKKVFRNNETNKFYDNANFKDIYSLYCFDEKLREIFFKYILKIERKIKSLYSYAFCEAFSEHESEYFNVNNYNYEQFQSKTNKLVVTLQKIKNSYKDKPVIKHSLDKHKNLPLWVLVNILTFGNMSIIFECSKQEIKSRIAREFSEDIYLDHLTSMLQVLSLFRNVCAHNERLYCYTTKAAINDVPLHTTFQQKSLGKNDLFAVCICFKYLLEENIFRNFLDELKSCYDNYMGRIHEDFRDKIRNQMGFREDWYDILQRTPSNENRLVVKS